MLPLRSGRLRVCDRLRRAAVFGSDTPLLTRLSSRAGLPIESDWKRTNSTSRLGMAMEPSRKVPCAAGCRHLGVGTITIAK